MRVEIGTCSPARPNSLVRPVPAIKRSRPSFASNLDSRVSSSLATTKPSKTKTRAPKRLGMKFATLVHNAVIAVTRLWVQRSSSIFNQPYQQCEQEVYDGKPAIHGPNHCSKPSSAPAASDRAARTDLPHRPDGWRFSTRDRKSTRLNS